jgi:hypothetical protein
VGTRHGLPRDLAAALVMEPLGRAEQRAVVVAQMYGAEESRQNRSRASDRGKGADPFVFRVAQALPVAVAAAINIISDQTEDQSQSVCEPVCHLLC